MDRDVSVSLFKSVVLLDVVKIISSDNNSSLHLCLNDDSFEDSASDANI